MIPRPAIPGSATSLLITLYHSLCTACITKYSLKNYRVNVNTKLTARIK